MNHTVKSCANHKEVAKEVEGIQGKEITPEIERELMNNLMLPDDDTVVTFTNAFASFDLVLIKSLLADDGVFEIIRDEKLEPVEVSKIEYLEWLATLIKDFRYYNEDVEKLNFSFDRCWGCSLGGYVTLFHDGKFPIETIGNYQRDKIGLLMETTEKRILKLSFCYRFQHSRNQYNSKLKAKLQ